MKRYDRVIVFLLASLFLPLLPATPTSAAMLVPAISEADEAFEPLRAEFERLYNALRGMGGMREADVALVRDLRDRVSDFNASNPGHVAGLVCELQLSMWLEDQERVEQLFQTLAELAPDKHEIGEAWARYATRTLGADAAEPIFELLIELYPQSAEIRSQRARQLRLRHEYPRALHLLRDFEFDPEKHAETFFLKSQILFAEHRFEEALQALDRIPGDVLERNRSLSRQVESQRMLYSDYVGFWEEEQERRAAEASADDLPRIVLTTERGMITLELFEDDAPNTVANFINLVEDGFYDSTRFHRLIANARVFGGDPRTRANGEPGPTDGPGFTITDEHTESYRRHFAGSLAMQKGAQPDTAGSQFYITHEPLAHLNGRFTVFGRVIDGLDVVRSLQRDDQLLSVSVLRKRDHAYEVERIYPEPEMPADTE